jgi:anti-anti-sigma regulatory factor
MLKITTAKESGRTKLRLEGRLAGPWVKELKESWQQSAAAGEPVGVVELNEVIFIDAAGKKLLADMHRQGVALTACSGCMTRAITEEILRGEIP